MHLLKLGCISSKARIREREEGCSNNVLSDITVVKKSEPASLIDALEAEISARVSFIAADDARRENSLCGNNVAKSDVANCNKGLSLALLNNRVKHATWTIAIWLLLLLRSDINAPPNRHTHLDVFIEDVLYNSSANIARICLNIYSLNGHLEIDVTEGHISDASVIDIRRDRAYCHTNTISHVTIFNNDILCASCNLVSAIGRLDRNCIVKVGD